MTKTIAVTVAREEQWGGGLCAKHLGFWKVGESQRQETKFVF